jgi:hypothetical protein
MDAQTGAVGRGRSEEPSSDPRFSFSVVASMVFARMKRVWWLTQTAAMVRREIR